MSTLSGALTRSIAIDPPRPLLTWYDDASGERSELSGATLANWVGKTANLIVYQAGLGPGSTVAVDLPPHWQTAVIMLGSWTAGVAIDHSGQSGADASFGLPGSSADYVTQLHPFALPVPALPAGSEDYVLAARAQGDGYAGPPADPSAPALVGLPGNRSVTHAELLTLALERAAELGVTAGDRVLINADEYRRPMDWLVAPIAAGASLVVCRNADSTRLERLTSVEKTTKNLYQPPLHSP